jgi:hypothetical protein
MATIGVQQNGSFGVGAGDSRAPEESLAERLLPLAAMVGATGGALAGAALGAANGAAFPVLWGGFGTMLGSGLTAATWCLCAHLCAEMFVGYEDGHVRDHAAAQQVNPEPSAE